MPFPREIYFYPTQPVPPPSLTLHKKKKKKKGQFWTPQPFQLHPGWSVALSSCLLLWASHLLTLSPSPSGVLHLRMFWATLLLSFLKVQSCLFSGSAHSWPHPTKYEGIPTWLLHPPGVGVAIHHIWAIMCDEVWRNPVASRAPTHVYWKHLWQCKCCQKKNTADLHYSQICLLTTVYV